MNEAIAYLIRHGEALLFVFVLAEQIGLPIPAVPMLLAAGVLVGAGTISLAWALGLSLIACFIGDVVWYELGRRRGRRALDLLCRMSWKPDSCVCRTEEFFKRYGLPSLMFAKFIPGISTVTPAGAGMLKVGLGWFVLYDGIGALLWISAYMGLGYLLSGYMRRLVAEAVQWGSWLGVVVAGVLAAYIAYKLYYGPQKERRAKSS